MSIQAHPGLPEFDYICPTTLAEASDFLASHPDTARPFLGGTDVFVRMRDGLCQAKFLVDIKKLAGTDTLHFEPGAGLILGAAVNMNRVIACPEIQEHYALLAEACRSVAGYQLRSRATVIGNLCNASPAGDTTGACLVLDGQLQVYGINGRHQVSLGSFFLGPGKTCLAPGDIVTAIHFPPSPPGSAGVYLKLGRNRLSDLAIVGVTVLAYPDAQLPSGYRFRLALASVAPIPLAPMEAEAYLASQPNPSKAFQEAACLAAEACSPIDDVRGGAQYRKAMVRNLTARGLELAWEKVRKP